MTATEHDQIVLQEFDPDDLLSDKNVRFDTAATVDADFTASIREFGNIEPITVVRTAEGQLRIRTGHRRAAACKLAKRPVRGLVIGDERDTPADQIARLYQQFSENHHRTGLTQLEDAGVVAALFDLGQTEAGISKKTRLSRDLVRAARAVSGSELAAKAAERYDLNLMQAAVIADFGTEDVQAVTALVKAARDNPEQFDHVAQQLRDNAAERAQKTALVAQLTEDGYQVTDEWHAVNRAGWHNLRNWVAADGTDLDEESHATCPHRAVRIEQELTWPAAAEAAWREANAEYIAELRETDGLGDGDDPEIEFDSDEEAIAAGHVVQWVVSQGYCANPSEAGHKDRYEGSRAGGSYGKPKPEPGSAEAEKVKEERRALLRQNREWRSATEVRTAHLKTLLTRKDLKLKPKSAVDAALAYIADAIARGEAAPEKMGEGHALACRLAGLTSSDPRVPLSRDQLAAVIEGATPARRLVIALGMILAGTEGEDGTYGTCADVHTWQRAADGGRAFYGNSAFHSDRGRAARYLAFLEAHTGYALTGLEKIVAHGPEDPPAGAERDSGGPATNHTGTAAEAGSGEEADGGTQPDVAPPATAIDTGSGAPHESPAARRQRLINEEVIAGLAKEHDEKPDLGPIDTVAFVGVAAGAGTDEQGRTCIFTGDDGEDPADHGTHGHEYDPATQAEPGHEDDEPEWDSADSNRYQDEREAAGLSPDDPDPDDMGYAGDDAESSSR
jgi:ParB family chromosome partitioning protein